MLVFRAMVSDSSAFRISGRDPASMARRGHLYLSRGTVETPCFMPVGTLGAVKGVSFDRLDDWDCRIVLANSYHLMLRPGAEVIRRAGGLHRYIGWHRPILTDSGGFQVMSLEDRRLVEEDGVEFRSHLDGAACRLTPEIAMDLQDAFGSDIAMCLDVFPALPSGAAEIGEAVGRTTRWAARCKKSWRGSGLLFGIVQGGTNEALRRRSAAEILEIGFAGYAIGGVAVGESKSDMAKVTELSARLLPDGCPRYLMGVGTPADLLRSVRLGVDLFDCVLPTRNGRMGHVYTRTGEIAIRNARFAEDFLPLDPDCDCPVCRRHSRAYLRHLFLLKDITAPVLLSIHNVYFYLNWMRSIRDAIEAGTLAEIVAPPEEKIA